MRDRYYNPSVRKMNSQNLIPLKEKMYSSLSSYLSAETSIRLPTPLHDIIFQYSLPPCLDSYGISFDKILTGKITARMYYKLSIEVRGNKRRAASISDILRCIHRIVRYGMRNMKVSAHGDIIAVTGTIKDPARDIIRDEFPSILLHGGPCSKCRGLKIINEGNYCPDCFGIGREITNECYNMSHPRTLCEEARMRRRTETPDEITKGLIQRFHGNTEITLTSIYTAFHVGTSKERILDYSEWEKGILSVKSTSFRV